MNQYLLDKVDVINKTKPDIIKIEYNIIKLEIFKKKSIKIKKIEFSNKYFSIKDFQSFIQRLEENEYLEIVDNEIAARILISKKYLLKEKKIILIENGRIHLKYRHNKIEKQFFFQPSHLMNARILDGIDGITHEFKMKILEAANYFYNHLENYSVNPIEIFSSNGYKYYLQKMNELSPEDKLEIEVKGGL